MNLVPLREGIWTCSRNSIKVIGHHKFGSHDEPFYCANYNDVWSEARRATSTSDADGQKGRSHDRHVDRQQRPPINRALPANSSTAHDALTKKISGSSALSRSRFFHRVDRYRWPNEFLSDYRADETNSSIPAKREWGSEHRSARGIQMHLHSAAVPGTIELDGRISSLLWQKSLRFNKLNKGTRPRRIWFHWGRVHSGFPGFYKRVECPRAFTFRLARFHKVHSCSRKDHHKSGFCRG